ncbi:MAG TPA: diadenylate cyclase CdaA [Anaerolineales bacterium]|nr:diadenylate cyclase CdaA [Anaerolineales bacterium]
MSSFIEELLFILRRFSWTSALDILLVSAVILGILLLVRDTQAVLVLRGVVIIFILLGVLASIEVLPAFSWLVETTFPALLVAIPVIFAPEIRRAFERIGRASNLLDYVGDMEEMEEVIDIVVRAAEQLSDRRHGALIVMQRFDSLAGYTDSGIELNAQLSDKILLQLFYPNSPLHDGAVILAGNRVVSAASVMPLASGNIQKQSPQRQLGTRHRAALGISEVTDAVAVIVSEETGVISVASGGRIIRRLDAERLRNLLSGFFRPLESKQGFEGFMSRLFTRKEKKER